MPKPRERWRPVPLPGYGEFYEVSDQGRIRSRHKGAWKVLKPQPQVNGYMALRLCAHGEQHQERVHALVLLAFVGPRPLGCVGAHADQNIKNNKLSNLAWVLQAENLEHRRKHGSLAMRREHLAKLTEDDVREIRRLAPITGQTALRKRYGVSQTLISQIVRKVAWIHVTDEAHAHAS